ncbi:MAG: lectin [Acidimicrobiales bacterium]
MPRLIRTRGGLKIGIGIISVLTVAAVTIVAPTVGAAASGIYVSDPASLVNTFIGTLNGGDTFPGADVPFGMMQWSPDTVARPYGGGYYYNDLWITGYSLTHLSGPGCPSEGDVPILPTTGAIGDSPGTATQSLHHPLEVAQPGYYQLTAGEIETQISTTLRAGIARFTFPSTTQANLLFKLSDSATGDTATSFHVVNDHEVSGYVTSGMFCGATNKYTLHFDMTFNTDFTSHGVWTDKSDVNTGATELETDLSPSQIATDRRWAASRANGATATSSYSPTQAVDNSGGPVASETRNSAPSGADDGAYVTFNTSRSPVVVAKIGISYVSTANARQNAAAEIPGWSVDTVRSAANEDWNQALDRIKIAGGTAQEQSVFYTALYHSLLHPNVASDVDGQYIGADGKVHTVIAGQQAEYANYSGWDIYRSEIPLESMLFPQQASDMVTSLLESYKSTGMLSKWSEDNGETYIMVGDPADSIIADAYAYGARNFNADTALQDMEREATEPSNIRPGLDYFMSDGYLPIDGSYGCCNYYGPVSTQEEYDVADDSISLLAADLGQKAAAKQFASVAQNWQNVFDPDSGFLQPKEVDGQFRANFSPRSYTGFVEADSYIYTAELPFDLKGIIAAEGGNRAWVGYLDGLTESVTSSSSKRIQMGDEPSFDIPWEYDYAGAPYMTQQVVREIQSQLFPDTPAGLPGNDDLGAMSSWIVWSEIGAYPETPGSADVALGSPEFSSIKISLGRGKSIVESAPAAAGDSPYVQSVTVNGSSWTDAYLPGSLLADGGTVDWVLASQPDKTWASAADDAPPSDTDGLLGAIGYVSGKKENGVGIAAGSSSSLTIGIQNTEKVQQSVTWQASAAKRTGITVTPAAGGSISAKAEAKGTEKVMVSVAPGTPAGKYKLSFTFVDASGTALPVVVEPVTVTAG